jgi:hypothetical protein
MIKRHTGKVDATCYSQRSGLAENKVRSSPRLETVSWPSAMIPKNGSPRLAHTPRKWTLTGRDIPNILRYRTAGSSFIPFLLIAMGPVYTSYALQLVTFWNDSPVHPNSRGGINYNFTWLWLRGFKSPTLRQIRPSLVITYSLDHSRQSSCSVRSTRESKDVHYVAGTEDIHQVFISITNEGFEISIVGFPLISAAESRVLESRDCSHS